MSRARSRADDAADHDRPARTGRAYSILVEANVVTMFAAALIPGLSAVALFILTILIYVTIVPDAGPRGSAPRSRGAH